MIGKTILHYKILEKLGEGGMGVVYRAMDTKLERPVALKFLHPSIVGGADDQKRLVAEARAAASLTHSSICTIHEINEYEGQTFMVMSFIDGVTLRDRVLSDVVPVVDALRHSISIADGLRTAHEKGIIHRDIKSANVMIDRDGNAIIMDFGLARLTGQAPGEEKFSSGGTSAYMSPEQTRGEAVDQRTDIWSLGVVLYEMLAGQLPFRGTYEEAVVYSILNEDPPAIETLRSGVPADIVAIVNKCLAKSPDERFQTLEELLVALREALDAISGVGARVSGGGSSRRVVVPVAAAAVLVFAAMVLFEIFAGHRAESEVQIPIAVADFSNETGEAALDGLSGMLITSLEQSRRLSVMTRTRMFDILKGLGRSDIQGITESVGQEICRVADIRALVIPTIRKFGDLYTIDLKVLDTRNNRYIVTTKDEGRGQESIPGMVDRIARDIRIDLKEEPATVEAAPQIADVTTVHMDAYQAYFKGEELLNHLKFDKAREQFQTAVDIDPEFALAYYRLAYTDWWTGKRANAAKTIKKALEMIDRIPEKERYLVRSIDASLTEGFEAQLPILRQMQARYPDDKEMLFGIGDAFFHSNETDSAETYFNKVLALDPRYDRALQHMTWLLVRGGRLEEGVAMAQRWYDTTGETEALVALADAQEKVGNDDAAVSLLEGAYEKTPDDYGVAMGLANMYARKTELEKAKVVLERLADKAPERLERVKALRDLAAGVYAYEGRFREAQGFLDRALKELTTGGDYDSSGVARVYSGMAMVAAVELEDFDAAKRYLDKAQLLGPDNAESGGRSMFVCTLLGDTARAERIYQRVSKAIEGPQHTITDLMHASATGRCTEAAAIVDTVVTRFGGGLTATDRATLEFVVGTCLMRGDMYEPAIERLSAVVDQNFGLEMISNLPPAYCMLAEAQDALGNSEEAYRWYARFIQVWANADDNIPSLQRARKRFAELKSTRSM